MSSNFDQATTGYVNSRTTKNYILYNDFENGSTLGWGLGSIGALTNGIPTGTPSFNSSVSTSLSISTVSLGSQIGGSYSMSYISTAATTVGNMVATQTYNLDKAAQAKVLTYRFDYSVPTNPSNGNFSGTSSNSFGIAVWDATNSVWLPVVGNFSMTQSSGVGTATGTVQTGATTAAINFCLYNINATSGAITLYLDDFYLGPETAPIGPAMTDWVAYTPIGLWITNTTYSGYWRRVGSNMEINATITTSGAPGITGSLYFTIPPGYTINTTPVAQSNNLILGHGDIVPATSDPTYTVAPYIQVGATNQIHLGALSQLSTFTGTVYPLDTDVTNTIPSTWGAGGIIQVSLSVPIVGWSSNVQMSSDTDTRVVAMKAHASTGASMGTPTASATTIIFNTTDSDTHGAYNNTTGIYTIPVTGYYSISAQIAASGNQAVGSNYQVQIYNLTSSSIIASNGQQAPTAAYSAGVALGAAVNSIYLATGTQIAFQAFYNGTITTPSYQTSPTYSYLTITRSSGPSIIAATESVVASYGNNANITGLVTGTFQTLTYNVALKDSHASMNPSTGIYTVPVSGTYEINGNIFATSSAGMTAGADLAISAGPYANATRSGASALSNAEVSVNNSLIVPLTTGQTVYLSGRVYFTSGTATFINGLGYSCYVSIKRIGN